MTDIGRDHAVFSISVTSELSGVNPQMLRTYEQRGLISPFRTDGGTRRYSRRDLDRIAAITALLNEGLNLAGVEQVLALREETARLRAEVTDLCDAAGPDRAERHRLRRENRALREQLSRRAEDGAGTRVHAEE